LLKHQDDYSRPPIQDPGEARQQAEALFRPRPAVVSVQAPTDSLTIGPAIRKPRILSAVPTSVTAARSGQPEPQRAVEHRAQLNRDREEILRRQRELRTRLEAIDVELRAIAAYEAARFG
jgi:hypothetical protein